MSTPSKLNIDFATMMSVCAPLKLKERPRVFAGHVLIDVDEPEPFKVSCCADGLYTLIHKNSCGAVFKVKYPKGTTETMLVRWCKKTLYTPDRSFVASNLVDDRMRVPEHYAQIINEFHDSIVEVTLREYIEGITAYEAWPSLSPASRHSVMCQVAQLSGEIHQIKSKFYGNITGAPVMSEDSYEYMTRMVVRSKLLNHVNRNWSMGRVCSSEGVPVLCHNALSPEHIILSGDKVVGVIGWGQADFAPLVLEKQWYAFHQCDSTWYEWYCHLASSICPEDKQHSLFYELCVRFVYELAWCNWDPRRRARLTEIEKTLYSSAMWLDEAQSDVKSHQTSYKPRHSDALRLPHPAPENQAPQATDPDKETVASSFNFDWASTVESDVLTAKQQRSGFAED